MTKFIGNKTKQKYVIKNDQPVENSDFDGKQHKLVLTLKNKKNKPILTIIKIIFSFKFHNKNKSYDPSG